MTNDTIIEINKLLEKKGELFKRFEVLTHEAIDAGLTSFADMLIERSAIIVEANEIQSRIDRLTEGYHNPDAMRAALFNRCDRSRLNEELLPIFDTAQRNFSVINRAIKFNDELIAVVKTNGDEVRENLKINAQIPKIAKFFQHTERGVLRERT